jgi:hypothetical protein
VWEKSIVGSCREEKYVATEVFQKKGYDKEQCGN